ncbi:MAG TPA: YceI family protein [Bacteroidia bacterium]|nr:YceI family protein [Bacteroidia bacterium]
MKKIAVLLYFILSSSYFTLSFGQIFMADSCRVSFFSATAMEDIDAENTISKPVMSTATGDIQISIVNQEFIFKSHLMQEHFNEDYMESDKYPHTVFKGKVNEKVDYTKDGANTVTVTGVMDMHGVKKTITIPGTITIQNGIIFLNAKFDVMMADYNIKVPKAILGSNLADHVAITFKATMKPYKVK